MARSRMIYPELWEDEHFGTLSDKAKILFISCISNADDDGRLSANPANLRALAFRFEEISIKKVVELLEEIENKLKNFALYSVNSCNYIQLHKWENYQKQRDDRRKPSKYPSIKQSADKMLTTCGQNADECPPKLSKVKLSQDKISNSVPLFFDYFLLKTQKAYKLTPDKKELISKRLKEGYSLEDLKKAVDNFVADDWDGRKNHLDLIYCIGKQKGKTDNLEKWINVKPKKDLSWLDKVK